MQPGIFILRPGIYIAAVLYFYHPKSGKKVDFFVKPPEDFLELFNKYFDEERSFEIFDPEFIVSCFDSGL